MLDMSWGELMLIGGVALVVIPPKDLPKALRTLGQMTTKVRRMAGEFQAQFNDAMREAELDGVRKDLAELNRSVTASTTAAFNPIETIRSELKSSIDAPAATTSMATPTAPDVVPSSPELAIAADVAEGETVRANQPVPEEIAPAEEMGAPPAIVAASAEPGHRPAPITPMELTGPGLEPMPEAAPTGHREGERA